MRGTRGKAGPRPHGKFSVSFVACGRPWRGGCDVTKAGLREVSSEGSTGGSLKLRLRDHALGERRGEAGLGHVGGKLGKGLRYDVEGKLQNHKVRRAVSLDSRMESEGMGEGRKIPLPQACTRFLGDVYKCSKTPRVISKAGTRQVLLLQKTVCPWSQRHPVGQGLAASPINYFFSGGTFEFIHYLFTKCDHLLQWH